MLPAEPQDLSQPPDSEENQSHILLMELCNAYRRRHSKDPMGYDLEVLQEAALEAIHNPKGSKKARGKAAMLLR
jgi:hypothetical protein